MTFLSRLFLFALPLVVVPVLIHLYRGRQKEVISWGAMQFLANAVTKGRRMEKLEELLLMALRVGAILAVVLALARPMLRGSWWGEGSAGEVVFVVDNSLSMARVVDNVSAINQMKENARALIDDLNSGDEVHILLAAGGGQWLTAEGVRADDAGKSRLAGLIESCKSTLGTADLLNCLQRVVALESESAPAYRRVVVFTDNQVQSWQTDAERAWLQLGAACRGAAVPTAIEIVDCGSPDAELDNLAVAQLTASRKLTQPGEAIEFSAQVANLGQVSSGNLSLEWLVDDEVVDTTELESLDSDQSSSQNTTLRLDEPGSFAVTCRIKAEDQIALDQQETVIVEISDRVPILLIHNGLGSRAAKSAADFFATALGYVDGKTQSWHSIYEPKLVGYAESADVDFANYRCIVVDNLSELDDDLRQRLRDFVDSGGGLWLTLGENLDPKAFSRDWYDDGNGLSPVAIQSLNTIDDTNEPAGTIHPPSRDHPATSQLANTTQLDIDEARLYEHWQLSRKSDTTGGVSVLLESGDGSPLVVENYVGQGRVFVQAFPLDLSWSNLPQLKSYVVLIHDWLDYLSAGSTARFNLTPGSSILAATPPAATFASATLLTPDGNEVSLVAHIAEDLSTVRYSQTQLPGLYRVKYKSGEEEIASLPFYVARDPVESQLQFLDVEEQAQLTAAANLQFEADGALAPQFAELTPPEKPVWGFLLMALLALLAGELLLSNLLSRQRGGIAVSTT